MCNKSQKDGQKKGVDGHFPTSSGDHTWFQHIPCWLRGWGITEARHLVLVDEGGGGGGKVQKLLTLIVHFQSACLRKLMLLITDLALTIPNFEMVSIFTETSCVLRF